MALLTLLASAAVWAVTVDSSAGWDGSAPASNTIDGVFGSANKGKANPAAWVVFDFGVATPITKVRMCAPTYSGSGSQTVNPTLSTFGFSNDKSTWQLATTWNCPALESTNRVDMSEIAVSQAAGYRYMKWTTISGGQVGEFFFVAGPQLAVREMAQDTTHSNGGHAAWQTVDGNPATYGEGINTEGIITYDQGSSKQVYGFTLQGRHDAGSMNPTSGELWVSSNPTSGYVLVGSWTLPSLAAGQIGTVDLGVSNAVAGRYIQLRNLSGGSTWAEFAILSHIVHDGQATTAIIVPDSTFQGVQNAATELQYHIEKATGVTIPIVAESSKPTTLQGLIYLGNCTATQRAGITTASVGANGFVSKKYGNDIFILGDDSAGEVFSMNLVRVGTLFGVYDFLESKMGVRWLWPGVSGEVVPQTASLATPDVDKTRTPQLLHARIRDGQWATNYGWSTAQARDKFQIDQQKWQKRSRFARGISMEYGHSFEDWWSRFGASHPEYFNMLPDGTRRTDPYYAGGDPSLISMCVSQPGMHAQKVLDWQNTRTVDLPWVNCAENDTNGKCTCPVCMSWDVRDPALTDDQWNNRLTYATNDFSAGTPGWEGRLGSVTDRYARYYMAVLQQAQAIDPTATVIGYAYDNYQIAPTQVSLNDHVVIGHVPGFSWPWSDVKSQTFRNSWKGWYDAGARLFLRPNYYLDGHNYPIYFAERFGDDFTYAYQRGMMSTDFDSLIGQYAAGPLNMYMLSRKNSHGEMSTTDVLNEFYSAFGPAETAVRNYFAYLKSFSDSVTDAQMGAAGADWTNFYETGVSIFTPSVLASARSYMTLAQQAAAGNSLAETKVAYLEKGLHHAELQNAAAQAWKNYTAATGGLGAWTSAIEALDAYRVSVELDAVANMNFLRTFEDRTWQRTIPNMQVAAGYIRPLHGDRLMIDQNSFYMKNHYGSEIYLVVDLGQAKSVDKITITNRIDTATNYNIKAATIYVAPDESSPSFDPFSKLSYTTQVFTGNFSPSVNTAAAVRSADITNSARRYFLLKITSNFWGNVSDQNNTNAQVLYFADVGITLLPDSTPPTGSIVIDGGAQYAMSTAVTLALSATDSGSGVSQMRFSNDGSAWTSWESYAASKPYTLPAGDGLKTVYVQYKDGAGNISSSYNDSILLDTTTPTGSVTINDGAQYTYSTAVSLALSATDTGSGVAFMQFSSDGTNWTGWETYAPTRAWTLPDGAGVKTVYVKFKDVAGRESSPYSDTITLRGADTTGQLSVSGLLVTVWGRVRYRSPDAGYIYIDDGSSLNDLSGNPGLRILFSTSYSYVAPASVPQVDEYVVITGVTVKYKDPGMDAWIPAIVPRDAADIVH